jgi:hypothetical protein
VRLAELQGLLARAIEDPGSVHPGLLEKSILERAPLGASARVDVYAEMYRFRLADALRADFPRLFRLLGDEGFFALANAYAQAHPSASSDIGQFGRHLADFLQAHPGPRGDEADLAMLEWALAQAFTAPDAEPIAQDALAALGESAPEAHFTFVPALRTLQLSHDVLPVWATLEDSDEPPEVQVRDVQVAVWRQGFQVLHREMPDAEALALVRATSGMTLAETCEAFSEAEDAQQVAFRTLASWFSAGWVSRVESP